MNTKPNNLEHFFAKEITKEEFAARMRSFTRNVTHIFLRSDIEIIIAHKDEINDSLLYLNSLCECLDPYLSKQL